MFHHRLVIRLRPLPAIIFLAGAGLILPAHAENERDVYDNCLLESLKVATDSDSVGQLREGCEQYLTPTASNADPGPVAKSPGLIERRMLLERESSRNLFALTQHNSSYVLPVTYNDRPNSAPFQELDEGRELDKAETKFQFSFKAQLFDSILKERGRFFFGYTNQSHWQVFDEGNSRPFRETNHEPELFIDIDQDHVFGKWNIPLLRLGLVHESNGQSGSQSRTWNRIYGQVFFEDGKYAVSLKPWIQLGGDKSDDENPNIEQYMGNFELGIFRQGDSSATSVLLRNNLRSENRGAIEINWSKPLPYNKKVRFLLQYFYGYGETLIDYDVLSNRIGIGLQLSDFL